MKKMIFLGAVIVWVSVFVFMFGSVTVKAQTIELKFAHFMSPKHIQHQKSFDPFTEKVAELTKGQVKIKIYPGGALGKPKQLPDAVKTGITDIAFIIPAYTTARFPRISRPWICRLYATALPQAPRLSMISGTRILQRISRIIRYCGSIRPAPVNCILRPMPCPLPRR